MLPGLEWPTSAFMTPSGIVSRFHGDVLTFFQGAKHVSVSSKYLMWLPVGKLLRSCMKPWLIVSLLVLLVAGVTLAQSDRASITGTVRDTSGAVIPGLQAR